jgi:hypothetical protein
MNGIRGRIAQYVCTDVKSIRRGWFLQPCTIRFCTDRRDLLTDGSGGGQSWRSTTFAWDMALDMQKTVCFGGKYHQFSCLKADYRILKN